MTNIISKTNLPEYCHNQLIQISLLYLLGLYLTIDKCHPIYCLLSMTIIVNYSYFIHYLFHHLPDIISVHMNYHHSPLKKDGLTKVIHWVIELVTDIGFFAILYFFQKLIRFEVVPPVLIFYYGFIYVSVHVINYSIFHAAKKHVVHHETSETETPTTNYGPDIIDHLLGSNDEETFENYNHTIPNILVAFLASYYFYSS